MSGRGIKGLDRREALANAEEAKRDRAARQRADLDTLMESAAFASFLDTLAARAGLMSATYEMPAWDAGYRAALQDVVYGVVMNSAKGAEWLSGWVARQRAKRRDLIANEKENDKT